MKWKRIVFMGGVILQTLGITGCAAIPKVLISTEEIKSRKLAVFFDGTANDEASDTNIKKLHSLVTLQNRKEISTFYVEGVGANGKVVGMAMGWGIGDRERKAYQFLATNYREGDKIYLFGFSRGAYSARILASMLYHAGLPGRLPPETKLSSNFTALIYEAFKGDKTSIERKADILNAVNNNKLPVLKPVDVTFMGLWDTVEALGTPNYKEDFVKPNGRYGDQLCNVRRAVHALALDDDRARIFTPILLTKEHLLDQCVTDENGENWKASPEAITARLNKVVDEVWFAGAHSDVGGGYLNGLLSGVSLNWMIDKLNCEGLLPVGSGVRTDPDESIHDPEKGFLWGALYRQKWRSFTEYAKDTSYNSGKLKVHSSVITRLIKPERLDQSMSTPRDTQWRLPKLFRSCFVNNNTGGFEYKQSTDCQLEVVTAPSKASSEACSKGEFIF